MKRREFLSSVAVAALVAAVPSLSVWPGNVVIWMRDYMVAQGFPVDFPPADIAFLSGICDEVVPLGVT